MFPFCIENSIYVERKRTSVEGVLITSVYRDSSHSLHKGRTWIHLQY